MTITTLDRHKSCDFKEAEKLRTQIKDNNSMHTMIILNPDNQQLRVKYKKQRNELISLLRNSEINHYSDDLELHKSALHKTWGILKTLIGKDRNNLKSSLRFQVNVKCTTDSLEIANSFNQIFVSVGHKLAQNIISTVNPMSYVTPCKNSIVIPPPPPCSVLIYNMKSTVTVHLNYCFFSFKIFVSFFHTNFGLCILVLHVTEFCVYVCHDRSYTV